MAIDLYLAMGSPPCRAVLLIAAALNVDLNLLHLRLDAGEHLTPDFLKLNPQHTVPTIVDNGFSLWESRTIGRYLANNYGGETPLYPSDPRARAIVDQRLDFDLGTLYPKFSSYFYPQLFGGGAANPDLLVELEKALNFFNTFLEGQKYAAGSELTIADLSLVASVSTIEAAEVVNLKKYPNVVRWYDLVKSTAPKYEETNGAGVKAFKEFIKKFQPKSEL